MAYTCVRPLSRDTAFETNGVLLLVDELQWLFDSLLAGLNKTGCCWLPGIHSDGVRGHHTNARVRMNRTTTNPLHFNTFSLAFTFYDRLLFVQQPLPSIHQCSHRSTQRAGPKNYCCTKMGSQKHAFGVITSTVHSAETFDKSSLLRRIFKKIQIGGKLLFGVVLGRKERKVHRAAHVHHGRQRSNKRRHTINTRVQSTLFGLFIVSLLTAIARSLPSRAARWRTRAAPPRPAVVRAPAMCH